MKHVNSVGRLNELVRDRIQRSLEVKRLLLLDATYCELVTKAATQIVKTLRTGGKVLFMGNGGSAADAQHLAAEFVGRYLKERRALPALALSVNSSAVTAIGNDYGFDLVFARQIEALGKEGDVVIGISTSGNSQNVIRALEIAKTKAIYSIALTGESGGLMKNIADCTICIPSEETPRIQECHILTGHIICEIVELAIFENPEGQASNDDLAVAPSHRETGNR